MVSRARSKAAKPRAAAAKVAAPPSRAIAGWLAISFVLGFAALIVLATLSVPLGQGYFFFRYSDLRGLRTLRALPVLLVAGGFCGAVHLLMRPERRRRRSGVLLLCAALLAMGGWSWWAPPRPMTQQFFNMTSLSTDGAFRQEASVIRSLPQYLRHFPQRVRATPEELGGTRVLSNPPGTTIFAYAVAKLFDPPPERPGWLERDVMAAESVTAPEALSITNPLRFGIALTAVWVLSGAAAYALGRLVLLPAGAAVFAMIVTFNPCTVHFVPGKDPGQLLTINLMLWAWLASLDPRRRPWPLAGLAGALLLIGATFGLIHIWVALAMLAATVWQQWRSWPKLLRDHVLPAALGALAVIVLAYLTTGWNIPVTLLAVSRRWGELQGTFNMNRSVWYVIGLPIFLLFLSPGIWLLLGLSLRRWHGLNFGTRLAICTIAVMAFIYLGIGTTYELPRLWVAFLPPLVLGLAMDRPLLRGRGEHPRVAKVLMLIVLTQVVFTAFHWTFLDARETEYRLLSNRFYH